ncbi:MAG TPA: TIGR00730 family Rossman fold protein [Myxococcales bacterium]|nr:TIGR00730 family Rossman fold protein [Myxococcales bacterium]
MQRISVFAGSNAGARPAYLVAARELGAEIARRGYGIVYGGASCGLMGACADAALAGGAEVVGVLPRALTNREVAHTGLTEMRIVGSLHERKAVMSALSDAVVALPGGCGTLDELFEAITWGQLGLHEKPIGLLDVDGYYGPLLGFLEHMNAEGFVRPALRLVRARTARELLDQLLSAPPAAVSPAGPHPPP